jgi:hypothetical protein
MLRYLCKARVLLKDFGAYATGLSHRLRAAARDCIRTGLIGLFDIVEPCLTCFMRGGRRTGSGSS